MHAPVTFITSHEDSEELSHLPICNKTRFTVGRKSMPTRTKIKIKDDIELRAELDKEYETSSQIKLCRFALILSTHILEMIEYQDMNNDIIREGFLVNSEWQKGNARMHDVRQVGFKIHQMARSSDNIIVQTALRVTGHAVATGHMREHTMTASDYAIKVVNLLFPDNIDAVRNERMWQIGKLKSVKEP